jgi:hypothetical protein
MDPMHTALLTRIAPLVYEDSLAVSHTFRRGRSWRKRTSAPRSPVRRP